MYFSFYNSCFSSLLIFPLYCYVKLYRAWGGGGFNKNAHWVLVRVKQSMRSENTEQNGDHCHAALQEHAIAHFQLPPPPPAPTVIARSAPER